jgi:hypothetical protein
MDISTALDHALRAAGIPITGVSIGHDTDKSTWVISYDAAATSQQRLDAAALLAAFDPASQAVQDATLVVEATPNRRERAQFIYFLYKTLGHWPDATEQSAEDAVWFEAYRRAGDS